MWITIPLALFFKVHSEVPRLQSELTFKRSRKAALGPFRALQTEAVRLLFAAPTSFESPLLV
jgi:hypothetical protein